MGEGEELFSGLMAFCLLATGLLTTFLLIQHLSSILAIRCITVVFIRQLSKPSSSRRTLLTHLRGFLYIAIATCASAKVGNGL